MKNIVRSIWNNKKISNFLVIALIWFGMLMFISNSIKMNSGLKEYVLYWDDMAEHSVMASNETNFLEKVFDTSANKTRFLFNLVITIYWMLLGENYEYIGYTLVAANFLCNIIIWLCIYRINKEKLSSYSRMILSTIACLAFSASRFAYYGYTEIFGIMELMAIVFAIIAISFLITDAGKFGKDYWIAIVAYICSIYVHERYVCLVGVFVVYTLFSFWDRNENQSKLKLFFGGLVTLCVPLSFFGIRKILLGDRIIDGTNGQSVTDTFSIEQFLTMIKSEIGYLFGINSKNEVYLNGIDPSNVSIYIYILNAIIILCCCFIIITFVVKNKKNFKELKNAILIVVGIGCMIISSSVTIRVEMRWIYISYMLEVLLIIYMLENIIDKSLNILSLTIVTYMVIVSGNYYKDAWKNLYYWGAREESSSFVQVIKNYDSIEQLYVISNGYGCLTENEMIQLADLYDVSINNLNLVSTLSEIQEKNSEDVILLRSDCSFHNVANIMNSIEYISGYYDDGWIEPTMTGKFTTYRLSEMSLSFYLPSAPMGGNSISVFIDENLVSNVYVDSEGEVQTTIPNISQGEHTLKIVSDFYTVSESGRSDEGLLSSVLSNLKIY